MQDITPKLNETAQVVQSYGPAGFRIAGVDYTGSVLITATQTYPLSLTQFEAVNIGDFAPLFAMDPPLEILLIGTGSSHEMLPRALKDALREKGLPSDAMNTGAAARTYNILLSEERRVAALLVLPTNI